MTRPPLRVVGWANPNDDPQLCAVCGKLYSPFGFGERLWACGEHRAQVDAQAVSQGLVSSSDERTPEPDAPDYSEVAT